MAGLLEKFRIIAKSNLHMLLDRVIDLNSVEAVKQYCRELEDAITEQEGSVTAAAGQLRTANREKIELEHRVADLEHSVQVLVSSPTPNVKAATLKQAECKRVKASLQADVEEIASATATFDTLNNVLTALQGKHGEMVDQIHHLEILDRSTKAKEHAASAIAMAAKVTGNGADKSIDNIQDKMRRRADQADAALDMQQSKFDAQIGKDASMAEAEAEVQAMIANAQTKTS